MCPRSGMIRPNEAMTRRKQPVSYHLNLKKKNSFDDAEYGLDPAEKRQVSYVPGSVFGAYTGGSLNRALLAFLPALCVACRLFLSVYYVVTRSFLPLCSDRPPLFSASRSHTYRALP